MISHKNIFLSESHSSHQRAFYFVWNYHHRCMQKLMNSSKLVFAEASFQKSNVAFFQAQWERNATRLDLTTSVASLSSLVEASVAAAPPSPSTTTPTPAPVTAATSPSTPPAPVQETCSLCYKEATEWSACPGCSQFVGCFPCTSRKKACDPWG